MTSSQNLESWNYRPAAFGDSWLSEAFARDTDTLTKALQISLSETNDFFAANNNNYYNKNIQSLSSSILFTPETASSLRTSSVSGSDPETPAARTRPAFSKGRIAKRKSGATKRSTTTFITADPANFRQMVQQVTGGKLGGGQLPVGGVLKPEPQRAFNQFQGCLPTLDTSAFFLDQQQQHQVAGPAIDVVGQAAMGGGGFDFDAFSGFPTLESWRVV